MLSSADVRTPPLAGKQTPRPAVLAALVFVASGLVFAAAVGGPWIFDDEALIPGNRYVHSFEHVGRWFTSHLWDTNFDPSRGQMQSFWRPIVLASYALDWQLGAGSHIQFHVTNLLLHGAAAVLVFAALRRWLRADLPALIAALLFAVHPSKAESVAWVAGRADLLCTIGILLAAYGVGVRLGGSRWGIAAEVAGLVVAYGSKEVGTVTPIVAAVEAWVVAGRPKLGAVPRRWLALAVVPHLLVAVLYLAARALWLPLGGRELRVNALTHAGFVLESLGRYLELSFWPARLSLGRALVGYSEGVPAPAMGYALLGVATLAAAGVAVWLTWARRPAVAIGALLFVLALLPVSNVVSMGYTVLVSPRFLYLALLGVVLMVGDLFCANLPRRAIWFGLAGICGLALTVRSFTRSLDFAEQERFWDYEISQNPSYPPAHQYFVTRELNAGRPRAALSFARDAYQLATCQRPDSPRPGRLLVAALRAVLVITPDLEPDTLRAAARFARDVAERRAARFESSRLGLALQLEPQAAAAAKLRERQVELLMIEGEVAGRVGDDATAIAAAEGVLRRCPDCWTLLRPAAVAAARAERLDLALRIAENLQRYAAEQDRSGLLPTLAHARRVYAAWQAASGSQAAVLQTQYYFSLGAWGRAYQAARPAWREPSRLDRASAQKLAELAFRAGDGATAVRLLRRFLPSGQVRQRTLAWALAMHWVDAPRPAGEPLPRLPDCS